MAAILRQRSHPPKPSNIETSSRVLSRSLTTWIGSRRTPARPSVRTLLTRRAASAATVTRRYDLGREDGVAYGFTDATRYGDRVLFAAGAEDSPDAIEDGIVLGARIGVIEGDRARWAPILERDGTPSRRKIEGLAAMEDVLVAVVDADDTELPADLCYIALEGPW
jgi:hypothetical protein